MTAIGGVAASAGGVETLRTGLVEPLLYEGHTVAVTLTPTAAHWLRELGEVDRIQAETGLQVRDQPRTPNESRPHPKIDIYVAAPFTANSIAKLALGLADNQALTVLCENIAIRPMIVFPRINAAHARQPSWLEQIRRLESASVELIYGDHVWQLAEPRMAGSRQLLWPAILAAVKRHLLIGHDRAPNTRPAAR